MESIPSATFLPRLGCATENIIGLVLGSHIPNAAPPPPPLVVAYDFFRWLSMAAAAASASSEMRESDSFPVKLSCEFNLDIPPPPLPPPVSAAPFEL